MNVIGFDDAPFSREHRGDVLLIGAVCSKTRLDGVLSGRVRRDGANATARMIALIAGSPFAQSIRAVMLQGIAVAGFNVIDVHGLSRRLRVPVLVVARRPPDLPAICRALAQAENNGRISAARRHRLIERAGPMESARGVWIQRAGLDLPQAERLLAATTLHGKIPEPLRLAHLIAGGVATGVSRGRA